MDPEPKSRRVWEDLLFSALDRITTSSEKLKDPQVAVGSAVEWVKSMREDLQERIKDEIGSRISKLDFNVLARKVGDHLAKNYRLKIEASVKWEPVARIEDLNIKLDTAEPIKKTDGTNEEDNIEG